MRLIFKPPVAKLFPKSFPWTVRSQTFYNAGESNKAQVFLTRLYASAAGKYLPPELARYLRL